MDGDGAQENAEGIDGFRWRFPEDVSLILHLKVRSGASSVSFMEAAEFFGDGILKAGKVVGVVGLKVNFTKGIADGLAAEELVQGQGVGNEDLVIRIEPALIALGFQYADDAEVDPLDFDGLVQRVFLAKEIGGR